MNRNEDNPTNLDLLGGLALLASLILISLFLT